MFSGEIYKGRLYNLFSNCYYYGKINLIALFVLFKYIPNSLPNFAVLTLSESPTFPPKTRHLF